MKLKGQSLAARDAHAPDSGLGVYSARRALHQLNT